MKRNKKQRSVLGNWRIEDGGDYYCLRGTIFDHGNFINGERIFTPKLVKIDFVKKRAETKNTIYRLVD